MEELRVMSSGMGASAPSTPFPPVRITYALTIRFSSLSSEFSFQVGRLFEIAL
jgi:hypothetical protein